MAPARFRQSRRVRESTHNSSETLQEEGASNLDDAPTPPKFTSSGTEYREALLPITGEDEAFTFDNDTHERRRQQRRVRSPRRHGSRVQGDLVGKQGMQGHLLGDRYVRVCRVQTEDFERAAPGRLIATEEALAARGPVGRTFGKVKRTVIG